MGKILMCRIGILFILSILIAPLSANADRILPDGTLFSDSVNTTVVPEPTTILLLGLGGSLLGLGKFRKK
ncbi:MAG: PEP-CTERM sorting domain-containing protein [Candidatus Schekmanbacteria bacterium]|nr:PEP-CTERM sorting domain-containing protein [Candidatus Schekmanbacteria bacterium]